MSRFIPIGQLADQLCMAENDTLKRKKMRYLALAKDVWLDMNLSVVKQTRRFVLDVNKRLNTADLPCEVLSLSGVSVFGPRGEILPVYRNDSVPNDIVDLAADKASGCECGGDLCGLLKSYETMESTSTEQMPDGSSRTFKTTIRKAVDERGMLYEEKRYPARKYNAAGLWVDTITESEYREICQLEVDQKGCVCDTAENVSKVEGCGCGDGSGPCNSKLTSYAADAGVCFSRGQISNIYTISERGSRLYFPSSFGYDKVIVRCYVDISLKEMQIPLKAKLAFMTGLRHYDLMFNDKADRRVAAKYEASYAKLKFALSLSLNRYTAEELRMALTPPVNMF